MAMLGAFSMAVSEKSLENLQSENAKKHRFNGKRSKESIEKQKRTVAQKKQLKELAEFLFTLPVKNGAVIDVEDVKSYAELKNANIDVATAMILAQCEKAINGDTRAVEFLRDTAGQKPSNELDVKDFKPVVLVNDISPSIN